MRHRGSAGFGAAVGLAAVMAIGLVTSSSADAVPRDRVYSAPYPLDAQVEGASGWGWGIQFTMNGVSPLFRADEVTVEGRMRNGGDWWARLPFDPMHYPATGKQIPGALMAWPRHYGFGNTDDYDALRLTYRGCVVEMGVAP